MNRSRETRDANEIEERKQNTRILESLDARGPGCSLVSVEGAC